MTIKQRNLVPIPLRNLKPKCIGHFLSERKYFLILYVRLLGLQSFLSYLVCVCHMWDLTHLSSTEQL